MKNIFQIVLIVSSFLSYSQEETLSKYEKADTEYRGRLYSKLLMTNIKESLILKVSEEKFVVFENDKAYRYYLDGSKKMKRKKIKQKIFKASLQHLDSLKTINPSNLNVTKKSVGANGNDFVEIEIQDGITYRLSLFKNDLVITYETYAPESYIEEKFPFFKERKKLLNAFLFFDSLFVDK